MRTAPQAPSPPATRLRGLCLNFLLVFGCNEGTPSGRGDPSAQSVSKGRGTLAEERSDGPSQSRGPIELSLEARAGSWEIEPGRRVDAFTYNGTVPGPTIRGRVGDEVVVHFKNSLDEPTTIHWHGLRISAAMDGSPATQRPVPAGGEFEYRFTLPDAGTFWYHPHVRESEQMERGLYGAIVVEGDREPEVDADHLIVLDDVRIDSSGQIAPGSSRDIYPGREGNVLLVNGRRGLELNARRGQVQRWRFINVANARFFLLRLEDHSLQVIGSDGGFAEAPRTVDQLLITPGDRFDVLVSATGEPGSESTLLSLPVSSVRHGHGRSRRGHGRSRRGHARGPSRGDVGDALLRMEYSMLSPLPAREVTVPYARLPDLGPEGIQPTVIRLGDRGCCGSGRFTINGVSHPNVPPQVAYVGQTQVWNVWNDTRGPHPFHLHGYFFQVLGASAARQPVRAWEDNLNIPPGEQVRIAFRPEGRPGRWLYHCHILEHGEHGMAAELVVIDRAGAEPNAPIDSRQNAEQQEQM